MFENSEDYLLDYIKESKCTGWVAKVIKIFLSGKTEEYIVDIAKELIGTGTCDITDIEVKNMEAGATTVFIKELLHISGVNALADKQKIKFCDQVNVIYGLNGTGKSSYFRILNEIVGGKRETPILPNVYMDKTEDVSVNLKCTVNNSNIDKTWNGQKRAIRELVPVRVFDSKYTESMLKKRESDELVVKPYGLNAFEELNDYIVNIVSKAEELVASEETSLPIINWESVHEDSKLLFDKDIYSHEEVTKINDVFEKLSKIDFEKDIKETNSNIIKLQVQNPKDKLKIEEDKSQRYERLVTRINVLDKEVKEKVKNVSETIDAYLKSKADSDEFCKQIKVLNTILGVDSEEWKKFISAGSKYVSKVKLEDECPYCHRPYDKHSLDIVKAYAEFIGNDSEQQLKDKLNELLAKREIISQWNTDIVVEEKELEEDIFTAISNYKKTIEIIKQNLLKKIDEKKDNDIIIPNIKVMCSAISEKNEACKKSIELYSADSIQKQEKIILSNEKLSSLLSNKSLEEQKDNLLLLIQKKNIVAGQKEKIAEVTKVKTNISNLSKKAHKELLTSQLQVEFTKILQDLIKKPIEVELKGKNNAGKQQTELAIKNKKDVTSILSEGEQKAAALALFLAEIKVSHNKSTIILDDPVNSLDHKIIGAFTNQLMDLDNQLIIFTHNKLFLDSLETTSKGHICKGLDSACNKSKGKHIFLYETQSEGISRKGVIAEKAKETSDLFLSRAEEKLKQSPFLESTAVCANIRQAIEEIIDESVFNKQSPNKFSNKNGRINWDELKRLNPDKDLIDTLHEIHGRCSGGELHLGAEREENPVEADELQEMCKTLRKCGS